MTSRLQEGYDEIIGNNTNEKCFIRSLTRIFALLLHTKVDTINKIKNTKNCHRNNTKNMARTKVTPKRRPQTSTVPPWLINKAKDNPSRTKNNQHNKKMATS